MLVSLFDRSKAEADDGRGFKSSATKNLERLRDQAETRKKHLDITLQAAKDASHLVSSF